MDNKPKLKANEIMGASGQIYRESLKFNEWFRLVLDKKNRDTFGNFTQAALIVYGLDEADPKQYATACAIGSQNFRKVKDIASLTLHKEGLTFSSLMEVLRVRALTSPSSNWWEIAMDVMGYRERKSGVHLNQNNQYNIYTPVTDEQLTDQLENIAGETLREETLIEIFVEGDVSAGEEQSAAMAFHPQEFQNESSPDESLPQS